MNILNNWTLWGGVLNLSFVGLVVSALVLTHITIQTVTVYLHRTLSHRALYLHPIASHFFRFWNWLTTGMNGKEFAAVHRKHHAKVDTEEDPHTPVFFGLHSPWKIIVWVFFVGVRKYVAEARNKETTDEYGAGTPNDWIERNLYVPHNFLGVGILLGIINVFLFGLPGLIIWGVQALWIPVFATGIINGLGHRFGYTNYDINDPRYPNVAYSTNISPVGILIGGEELHNNHHAHPASPFFAHKWWECDWGSVTIRLLCLLRLAKLRIPLVPSNEFQRIYYKVFNLG